MLQVSNGTVANDQILLRQRAKDNIREYLDKIARWVWKSYDRNISRPGGGTYYAEGKGVFMAKNDPSEIATWTGQGVAHYSGQKRRDVSFIFCRISSTTGKLDFLIT
jgi:hypothetical protein